MYESKATFSNDVEAWVMETFQGIFSVMLTAYTESGGIDTRAMTHMTEYLVNSGIHGLVVLGSNGECPYLTKNLQKIAIETVVEACEKRVPVIVGINERGTEPALETASFAREAGADGLLVALHVFYQVNEDEVFKYYEDISRESGLPILYYNYPAATNLKLSHGQIARIAEIDNVVGAKETIFDIDEIKALVDATDESFSVFTGTTLNLLASMSVGACGAICPLPNVIPDKTLSLYEAIIKNDFKKAETLQNEIYSLASLLAASPTPHAMLKEAMRLLGHPLENTVKSPLPQLNPAQAKLVRECLKGANLI